MIWTVLIALGVFLAADLIYTVRHYLVHHDSDAYVRTHEEHHERYLGARDGLVLDAKEFWVYTRSGLIMAVAGLGLSLLTKEPGFAIGAAVKWAHNYLFHLYQHRWWGTDTGESFERRPVRAGWGMASARYHAFHHHAARSRPFTYAETWAGFDRLLELAHPWLLRWTADARRSRRPAAQ